MGTDTISVDEEEIYSYDYCVRLALNEIFIKREEYRKSATALMDTWVGSAKPVYRVWHEGMIERLDLIHQTVVDGVIQTGYTARQREEIDDAFVGREDICPVASTGVLDTRRSIRTYANTPTYLTLPNVGVAGTNATWNAQDN